jgi:hypothetical protein
MRAPIRILVQIPVKRMGLSTKLQKTKTFENLVAAGLGRLISAFRRDIEGYSGPAKPDKSLRSTLQ